MKSKKIRSAIEAEQNQNVLYKIIGKTPSIESSGIYREYERSAKGWGRNPLAPRTVRKYLRKFIELGFVKAESGKGRRRRFGCGHD